MRQRGRVPPIAAILFFLAVGGARGDEPIQLDLEKCIQTAIRNSTLVLKSENDVELSGEQLLQSYAQFLPTVNAQIENDHGWGKTYYTFTGADVVNSRSSTVLYALQTSLNLFNGFADFASFKSAQQRKDASGFTLTRAKQQIATDVTQSYYQVILDQQLLEIYQNNLKADQAREALLNEQMKLGVVTLADASRQQSQVATDQALVISTETKLHDDSLLLLNKLRLDPKPTYQFAQPDLSVAKPVISEPEKDLIDQAMNFRTDLKAEQSLSRATDFDITTARGDYYPKLNLGFTMIGEGTHLFYQYSNSINTLPSFQDSVWDQLGNQIHYTVSLSLSWNILDRGLTRLSVSRARISADNTRIDLENKQLQVTTEVRQVYGDFASAKRNYDAAKQATIAANRAFQVIEGRFRVRASSYVDLIAAQAQYIQAQVTEAQSRVAFKFQSWLLDFYLGKTSVSI